MNTEPNNTHWVAIINPQSGNIGMHAEWSRLQKAFKDQSVTCVYMFTERPGHAIDLARDLILDGYRNIVVIGGDGTLNEVLNGVMRSGVDPTTVTLAVIPNGTGNDWARLWKIPFDADKSIALLKNGKSQRVDIGRCTYMQSGKPGERFFLNIAGMGYEVSVLMHADLVRWMSIMKGRSWIYALSVIYTALFTRAHEMTITANGVTKSEKIFTLSVGNGQYSGGGFRQTPMASPTDGALDVMIMSRLSFKYAIMGLKYLFRGKLLKHPAVKNIRANQIIISSAKRPALEVDGIVVHSSCPVTFTIMPAQINFIIPQD